MCQIHWRRLVHTSLKSVEVPPYPPTKKKKMRDFGGSCFLLYFHFFLTKSFRRKYRILQILWRMSEKSMEVISSIRELKFCFFWKKKWSVFSRFFTFLNFKNKILKKQRNFTARKHHDFRQFSENDLLNKIARIFLIFKMCGSIRV